MGKSITEAKRIINQYGTAFKMYYKDIACGSRYESLEDQEDSFNECYQGEYDSPEDYAEQYLEDCGVMEQLRKIKIGHCTVDQMIDLSGFVRDLSIDSVHFMVDPDHGSCHVFCRL
jgi:antirestriction protein